MSGPTPFTRLLVANRGEIAVRVMRTAQRMGLGTVAVYSQADAGAAHVRMADEAVCIGGPAPGESYLRIGAIIDAARRTGADAIHPGYGFLSENPALPAACAQAGIVFVGPGAEAIRAMGDKARAKALMEAAGVPCVPGYQGEDQGDERLLSEARRIGFPVMIKATAGGGGRGMRLVERERDFPGHLESAKSEAKGAFGSESVLLEKAIVDPRHVEIQIMADRHGNVIHLGERDCSVQRRHQKLIEEAPSPAVGPDLRAAMGRASVTAAKAIGYEGAGTFEYLLDAQGDFHFMEMNTRLQVEHPVTEAVTGLDLVEMQLRIAAGERLALGQEDVRFDGHAIELRLCAEDPEAGFMPQGGRLTLWEPADGIRVDHGLQSGAEVPPHYDSMIAKLVAHGPTREDARQRLLAGLRKTVAMGLRTNKDFLGDCLAHPVFAAGGATTGFVAEHGGALSAPEAGEARAAMLAAALLRAEPGMRLTHGFSAPLRLMRGEVEYQPHVQVRGDGVCHVEMAGHDALDLRVVERRGHRVALDMAGARRVAVFLAGPAGVYVQTAGRCFDFTDLTFRPGVTGAVPSGDGTLRATMNGTVVSVNAAVGDVVEPGQPLVVIEAMKMEHAHVSPVAGRVTAVNVDKGAQVGPRAVLMEIAAG
ncbi:MAG: geranyl-CoA carboxylase alpha subunit [Rhodobacteraceae bacterium HLUCCO07]|nr:MAG: geranyl-CoA carboxylase alpha subunit [Rhodobacteraceae bacterium HLUCCO07]